MTELRIENIVLLPNGIQVIWAADRAEHLFDAAPLQVTYDSPVLCDIHQAANNLLATTLPVLAREFGAVRVTTPFDFDDNLKRYWEKMLFALGIGSACIDWCGVEGKDICSAPQFPFSMESGRCALLFGGGVESMFALSVLRSQNPVLISIHGERWMNNDYQKNTIKRELEDELVQNLNLDLIRISSNALSLIKKSDLYKNHYVSGILFYWHSLPICISKGVNTIYKSSEMEEALNFDYQDLSLHPTFLKEIAIQRGPLYLPLFNCYPKIQMLAELAKTPLLEYIYSCYHNTAKRWCGKCSKCFRISEFCERLGINKTRIGMQEGITGLKETGSISRHYWELADRLYGKRRLHDLKMTAKYYAGNLFKSLRNRI